MNATFYVNLTKLFLTGIFAVFICSVVVLVWYLSLKMPGDIYSKYAAISFAILVVPIVQSARYLYDPVGFEVDRQQIRQSHELRKNINAWFPHIDSNVAVGVYLSDFAGTFSISSPLSGKSIVGFSSKLMQTANGETLAALAARELAHIKNGDSKNKSYILALYMAVCANVVLFAGMAKSIVRLVMALVMLFAFSVVVIAIQTKDWGPGLRVIENFLQERAIQYVWAPIAIVVCVKCFYFLLKYAYDSYSQKREFAADADAVLATSPSAVMAGLDILSNRSANISVFDTPPPLEERKQRIHLMANRLGRSTFG